MGTPAARRRRAGAPRPRSWLGAAACTGLLVVTTACTSSSGSAGGGATGTAPPVGSTPSGSSAPGTTIPPWAGGPDPCMLLARSEVSYTLGFTVDPEPAPVVQATAPDPTRGNSCTWRNPKNGYRGGYVAITEFSPQADLQANRSAWTDVQEVPGIGRSAYVGHYAQGLGQGINSAVVDMGDGGFVVSVFAFQALTRDNVVGLAERAARRWDQNRNGGIPVDPRSTAVVPGDNDPSIDPRAGSAPTTPAGPTPAGPTTAPVTTAGVGAR